MDLGHPGFDVAPIRELCEQMQVPYTVVKTDIAQIIFEERKESNPCSLCAKMRKGALNEAIKKTGCNKVAYAHHKDDIVETMLLSLIFEGRFHSFSPKTYLDRMDLTVIRPLMYVGEADIKGFMNKYHLPVVKSPCPADGYTKREYAKNLVRQLNLEHPGAKESSNRKGYVLNINYSVSYPFLIRKLVSYILFLSGGSHSEEFLQNHQFPFCRCQCTDHKNQHLPSVYWYSNYNSLISSYLFL